MKKLLILIFSVALAFGIASSASAASNVYTVQKGDSLWTIAQKYNVSFQKILTINNLKNPNLIYPNQKIILPTGSTGTSTNNNSAYDKIENGNNTSTEQGTSTQAEAVLKLVNQERSKQGLKSLTLSTKLTSIATTKTKDMAVNKYFSHTSPTYGDPFTMLQSFGVSYHAAGENIAKGQATAQQVMDAWMRSSGHRANILNQNYTQIGVGYYNQNGVPLWTQLFIKP